MLPASAVKAKLDSSNFSSNSWLGNPPAKTAELIALLSQLLPQRGQRGGNLRQLSLLGCDVEFARVTRAKLAAQNLQHLRGYVRKPGQERNPAAILEVWS